MLIDPILITTKSLQEQAMNIIILTATKQMKLSNIPKYAIDSIIKELEIEKKRLLEAFNIAIIPL